MIFPMRARFLLPQDDRTPADGERPVILFSKNLVTEVMNIFSATLCKSFIFTKKYVLLHTTISSS